jgi:predicted GIY-YIG superfamily endonuclease
LADAKQSRMPFEALAKKGRLVYYVYLIESLVHPEERYIGSTEDLRDRIAGHNAGRSSHTAKHKPWKLITYIAFSTRAKAEQFERYLKSGSGHAFAQKRLW